MRIRVGVARETDIAQLYGNLRNDPRSSLVSHQTYPSPLNDRDTNLIGLLFES